MEWRVFHRKYNGNRNRQQFCAGEITFYLILEMTNLWFER